MDKLLITAVVLIVIAMGLAAFEVTLYKRRHRFEGDLFQYTRKRLVRRLSSAILLIIITIMILVGVGMAENNSDPLVFDLYWLVCFLLILTLAVLPLLDFIETYKGFQDRHKKNIERYAELSRAIDKKNERVI